MGTWERRKAVVLQYRIRLSSVVMWASHRLNAGKLDSQSGRTPCSRRTSSCRLATLDRREPFKIACSALSASKAPTSLICAPAHYKLSPPQRWKPWQAMWDEQKLLILSASCTHASLSSEGCSGRTLTSVCAERCL